MTYFIIVMVDILLLVAISKWVYKLHKRNDIVPYHMFAENYFEKDQMLEWE